MLECARIVVYSFVESAPPYYAFGLFVLDFSNFGLAWIAAITYGYKIAPPNLAATMASIVNMMQYVLGLLSITCTNICITPYAGPEFILWITLTAMSYQI